MKYGFGTVAARVRIILRHGDLIRIAALCPLSQVITTAIADKVKFKTKGKKMSANEVIDNFREIVTKKYFCFDGRAGRKEFWYWILVTFVVSLILSIIPKIGKYLASIWSLGILLPSLGVFARRLHDLGKTALLILIALIPAVGGLILLILCIPEGSKEANQYGEAPTE